MTTEETDRQLQGLLYQINKYPILADAVKEAQRRQGLNPEEMSVFGFWLWLTENATKPNAFI